MLLKGTWGEHRLVVQLAPPVGLDMVPLAHVVVGDKVQLAPVVELGRVQLAPVVELGRVQLAPVGDKVQLAPVELGRVQLAPVVELGKAQFAPPIVVDRVQLVPPELYRVLLVPHAERDTAHLPQVQDTSELGTVEVHLSPVEGGRLYPALELKGTAASLEDHSEGHCDSTSPSAGCRWFRQSWQE